METVVLSCAAVLGQDQAVPDASEAPAGLHLPTPCSAQESSPVHAAAGRLPHRPLDPQIHLPRHHLPRHGLGLPIKILFIY